MPASASRCAIRQVVVVLPWAPATAMPNWKRISSHSIAARGITGMRAARAAASSGLSAGTAEDATVTSLPAAAAARWPRPMRAPSSRSRRVCALSCRSLPVTS